MKILGIKMTHDAAISMIDDGKLVFCHEMEKINNFPRYSEFKLDIKGITEILYSYGYSFNDINGIAVDGWGYSDYLEPVKYEKAIDLGRGTFNMRFAAYGLLVENENLLEGERFDYSRYGLVYNSYTHIAGHIFSSYCTSPFAKENKPSFVLVWDGPTAPQMFYFAPESKNLETLGVLFPIIGNGYTDFSVNYEPYIHYKNTNEDYYLSVAGKVMAYIALGEVQEKTLLKFKEIYAKEIAFIGNNFVDPSTIAAFSANLVKKFVEFGKSTDCKPADMMAIYHKFTQDLLVESIKKCLDKYPGYEKNLCFSGGCALNIKWNSAIRKAGIVNDVWVAPFPNDSGSATGTACCEMVSKTGISYLDWNVYQGPELGTQESGNGKWEKRSCNIKELASLLHIEGTPVVFLNGGAELGPRALGNRSILAPAVEASMKDLLNKIKIREDYRPVAPICIEEDAPNVFDPGVPDPYMLFDHRMREDWIDRIPAVLHLDGTSRLQTINKKQNSLVYELLTEYKKLSGIPLLCNTSANLKGKGFFPDIKSAQDWGETKYAWCNQILYCKTG